jgi:hypothetical protein
VPHETAAQSCAMLTAQIELLRQFEEDKDKAEQTAIQAAPADSSKANNIHIDPFAKAFHEHLDSGFNLDEDVEIDEDDNVRTSFQPYLPDGMGEPPQAPDNIPVGIEERHNITIPNLEETPRTPTGDMFNNSYVRIVHFNGIHHLAMITCSCHGARQIPFDIIASGFLPASFTRIRTLFSFQVLDQFRVCNLELKATAYEYYNMIRRLTSSTSPSEVDNLAHEFRRMVRLWRWIKKLKWGGYGHNKLDPLNPPAGTLANFCAACPQPGINLAESWETDPNQ